MGHSPILLESSLPNAEQTLCRRRWLFNSGNSFSGPQVWDSRLRRMRPRERQAFPLSHQSEAVFLQESWKDLLHQNYLRCDGRRFPGHTMRILSGNLHSRIRSTKDYYTDWSLRTVLRLSFRFSLLFLLPSCQLMEYSPFSVDHNYPCSRASTSGLKRAK